MLLFCIVHLQHRETSPFLFDLEIIGFRIYFPSALEWHAKSTCELRASTSQRYPIKILKRCYVLF